MRLIGRTGPAGAAAVGVLLVNYEMQTPAMVDILGADVTRTRPSWRYVRSSPWPVPSILTFPRPRGPRPRRRQRRSRQGLAGPLQPSRADGPVRRHRRRLHDQGPARIAPLGALPVPSHPAPPVPWPLPRSAPSSRWAQFDAVEVAAHADDLVAGHLPDVSKGQRLHVPAASRPYADVTGHDDGRTLPAPRVRVDAGNSQCDGMLPAGRERRPRAWPSRDRRRCSRPPPSGRCRLRCAGRTGAARRRRRQSRASGTPASEARRCPPTRLLAASGAQRRCRRPALRSAGIICGRIMRCVEGVMSGLAANSTRRPRPWTVALPADPRRQPRRRHCHSFGESKPARAKMPKRGRPEPLRWLIANGNQGDLHPLTCTPEP